MLDFYQNYRFTIFQKIRIFSGFHILKPFRFGKESPTSHVKRTTTLLHKERGGDTVERRMLLIENID